MNGGPVGADLTILSGCDVPAWGPEGKLAIHITLVGVGKPSLVVSFIAIRGVVVFRVKIVVLVEGIIIIRVLCILILVIFLFILERLGLSFVAKSSDIVLQLQGITDRQPLSDVV